MKLREANKKPKPGMATQQTLYVTTPEVSPKSSNDTPSNSPFPVFALCQPIFIDTKIANNVWMKAMKGNEGDIDKERFMGEWLNLYKLLSAEALIYLIPPKKGLQDQTYVNSFAYLPHLDKKDVVVLSNFTAAGRSGEEAAAGNFLKELGYQIVKCPYKFEGEPELKYLHDNIYFGGYGQRSDIRAHQWIEKQYGAKIITVKESREKLYHLDCSLFVLDPENVMVCTSIIDPKTIKEIEKEANVHSVSEASANECICNSIRIGELVIMASSLKFLDKADPDYKKEWKKNAEAEKIVRDLGLEIIYVEMKEAAKSGAALSCFISHLNYRY